MRNFQLYSLEATYEIRDDIEDSTWRLHPYDDMETGATMFGGWSRMAIPLKSAAVVGVGQPKLGESKPAYVHVNALYSLENVKERIAEEWDEIRTNDVVFLLTLRAPTNQEKVTER